jgi:hypothetical protein
MADNQSDYNPLIDKAKQFLKFCNDANTMNRQEALEDLKFVNGDQWPVELQNSRNLKSRPVLTINKLDGYCRQVSNQQRQQRPRIKVHATNTQANAKVARSPNRHHPTHSRLIPTPITPMIMGLITPCGWAGDSGV